MKDDIATKVALVAGGILIGIGYAQQGLEDLEFTIGLAVGAAVCVYVIVGTIETAIDRRRVLRALRERRKRDV